MRKDIQTIKDAAKKKIAEKTGEIALLKIELEKANGEKYVTFKMPSMEVKMPDGFEVRNFPADQKVSGEVKVSNLPDVQKTTVTNLPETQKIAGEVHISNFPEKQSVNVLNLKDLDGLKVMADVKFPDVQDVRVTNESLKAEHWLPGIMARIGVKQAEYMVKAITALIEGGLTVRLSKDQFTEAVPVVVTDGEGKILKSLAQHPTIPMGGGRSPSFYVPIAVNAGNKTVAAPGTAVQLASSTTPCTKVYITALNTNTGVVNVGGASVSYSSGIGATLSPLGSFEIAINDVSKVWIDAGTIGDGVNFTYVS